MANIENLNFEVILKDESFRKKVAEDMRLADELNTHLSNALDFNKKVKVEPLKRITMETRKMREEMDKFNKSAGRDVTKRFTQMNTQLTSTTNLMRTISQLTGVAFSVVGLRRFLSSLIDITGQFEVQKMALRNMLQDLDGADRIFENLYRFSSESTYRFSELAKYAKQLAAFNIDQGNLLETTKMLGDVASGVGVSMDRVILAYGHVKSSGFLRGIQLRSFSQNGIPVLEELSKMLTEIEGKSVSLGDVFDKMMKREITFEMVEEAFKRMTSEGGKFYQMQEVLAKTLAGQINILKGKWENLMYAIGESQEGVLKGVVGALTKIVSSTESFGKAVRNTIAILLSWKTATIVAQAAMGTLTAANLRLVQSLGSMVGFVLRYAISPYSVLAAAIIGTTVAITKYTKAQRDINKIHEAGAKEINRYAAALSEENAELERLYARLNLATEGTEEYAKAKADIIKRFNPYIEQLRAEGKEVSDLTLIYDDLAKKIEDANRQRFLESATESMGKAYGDALATIDKEFDTFVKRVGNLTIAQQEALRSYYKGFISKDDAIAAGVPQRAFNYGKPGGAYAFSQGFSPYSMGFKEAGNSIDSLAGKYKQAGKVLSDTRKEVADAMDVIFGPDAGAYNGPFLNEDKIVTVAQAVAAIKKDEADIAKLEEKARTTGLIVNEKAGIDEQAMLKSYRDSLEEDLKQYKELTGNDYYKRLKATSAAQAAADKDEIQGTKAKIAILEKYRDMWEKLEPYFGEETNKRMAAIFGEGRDYSRLNQDILDLCQSLRRLGDDGAEAAEQIETRLGLDKASALIKAQKALQKWQTTLRKWEKDWGGGDFHGIEYDIDKVIREYNNETDEISQDFLDAEKELIAAHKGNAEAMQEELDKLFKLNEQRKAAAKTSAQEKLNDLAAKYVKEKTGTMNLQDWGDKSIGQVRDLYRTLTELANGEIVVDETLKNRLTEAGLKIEDFANLAKENFEELSEEARQELGKKLAETLRDIVSAFNDIAGAIKEYAEASGNLGLASAAEDFMQITSIVGGAAERILAGDIPGAIIGVLSSFVTGFFQAKAAAAQFEASLRSMREEARASGFSDMLSSGVDSIFGTNGLAKVKNAVAVMQKARASMSSNARPGSFGVKRDFWDYFWRAGARINQYSLEEMAQSVGRDLYDAYGNLNAETLQAILDTYEGLGQAEKEWIQAAINDSEAYAEAMEQLDDVMESVFGKIAGDAASQIVDQWAEAGDAALDYADILDDVARSYAKMITQSMLLDSVLTDDFKQALQKRFSAGDTAGAMELIMGGLQQMQAMAPEIAAALEPLRPYIQTGGSSSGNTLKEGINKELVEGNSTLIASYLNAMRADVSVIRALETSGWQDVRLVRESVPSLVEYSAQIAANTFDNAQSTQAILGKLQSIITPSTNGGSAVRTTK